MVRRDARKFEAADLDKDGKLDKEEYSSFLHPEETPHMQDIVVQVSWSNLHGAACCHV